MLNKLYENEFILHNDIHVFRIQWQLELGL